MGGKEGPLLHIHPGQLSVQLQLQRPTRSRALPIQQKRTCDAFCECARSVVLTFTVLSKPSTELEMASFRKKNFGMRLRVCGLVSLSERWASCPTSWTSMLMAW